MRAQVDFLIAALISSTESSWFYKNRYNTNSLYYSFVDSKLTTIISNNKTAIALNTISINVNNNNWSISKTGVSEKFYDTDIIDGTGTLQPQMAHGIRKEQIGRGNMLHI